jgi:hypothetical protein
VVTPKNARGRPVTKLCLALETFRRTEEGRIRDAKAFVGHFFPITKDGATDRLFVHIPKEVRADLLSSWGIRGKKSALRDDDEKVRTTVSDALGAGDIDETVFEEGVTPEILIDWVPLEDWWSFWRGNAVPIGSVRKALAVARELSLFDERWFLEHLSLTSQKLTGTDVICAGLSKDQIVAWIHAVHASGDASPTGLVNALGWETILAKTAHEALLHVLDTLARQVGLAEDPKKTEAAQPAAEATAAPKAPPAPPAEKPAAETPKPAAEAPKPTAAEAPKPAAAAEAPKPTAAEAPKPAPAETPKPAPVEKSRAAPALAAEPTPVETPSAAAVMSAEPVESLKPTPVAVDEKPGTVDFAELPVVEIPPEEDLIDVAPEPLPPPPPVTRSAPPPPPSPVREGPAEPAKPTSVVVAAKPPPRAPPIEHLPSVIIEPDPPPPPARSRQVEPLVKVTVEPDPFAAPSSSARPDARALFGAPDPARDLPPMRPPAATLAGVGGPPVGVSTPDVAIPSFHLSSAEDPPWAPPRAEPGDMGWDLVYGVKRPMSNNVQPRYNFDDDDEPTSEIALPTENRQG